MNEENDQLCFRSDPFLSNHRVNATIASYIELMFMKHYAPNKIKNWSGECRDVTPTKSLSQNIRVHVNREVKFL